MIRFKDFEAVVLKPGGLLSHPRKKGLDSALGELNRWVDSEGVEVINVETVLLPNLHSQENPTTRDALMTTSLKLSSTWSQIVRVWYRNP